jgi:four helix bundle protein
MHTLATVPGSAPVSAPAPPLLDAEKLDVFHVAVAFQAAAARLLPKDNAVLRDQLERASLSAVTNIAEGAGRHSRRDKARFYTIARGSAAEAAALIDVMRIRGLAPADDCIEAKALAVRVVQMLTRLQQRLAP